MRPRRHYAVNDALDDWLEAGLDGLAPSTVTVYRNTIAKALREELGTVELTKLTAGAVQKALANLSARVSTRAGSRLAPSPGRAPAVQAVRSRHEGCQLPSVGTRPRD